MYGIITHYDVHNHGALLQLTALVRVLRNEFQQEARALQFDKNYDFLGPESKNKYNVSIKSIGIYLNFLKERGFNSTLYNLNKRKTLEAYKQREQLIGNYYSSYNNLEGVIIGSDEVFALHTGPTPVFWGFGLPSEKVISYAGSFGPTTIEDIKRLHCSAMVKASFDSMQAVSVRDKNSASIVTNLTGRSPQIVVDPVLLYGYQNEIAELERPIKEKYIVIYAYDRRMNDPQEVKAIKSFAHERKLKIVSPGFYHNWADLNIDVDPINLLGWFRHSECVITDTFHGTIMSIITNSPMAVLVRDNSNKLVNLLSEYDLVSRIVSPSRINFTDVFNAQIDFSKVNESVNKRRTESLQFLKDQIN